MDDDLYEDDDPSLSLSRAFDSSTTLEMSEDAVDASPKKLTRAKRDSQVRSIKACHVM